MVRGYTRVNWIRDTYSDLRPRKKCVLRNRQSSCSSSAIPQTLFSAVAKSIPLVYSSFGEGNCPESVNNVDIC